MTPRQAPCVHRASAGFSLLELVVVVALIGLLVAIAAKRLLPYVADAERVAVMRLEGQLNNVLLMEAAQRIARGESARLVEFERSNPMAYLLQPPGTYLGELQAPARDELPSRSWHFDTDLRRLVYRSGRGFEAGRIEPVTREYSVRVRFGDRDGDLMFSPGVDEFYGVSLERVGGNSARARG